MTLYIYAESPNHAIERAYENCDYSTFEEALRKVDYPQNSGLLLFKIEVTKHG